MPTVFAGDKAAAPYRPHPRFWHLKKMVVVVLLPKTHAGKDLHLTSRCSLRRWFVLVNLSQIIVTMSFLEECVRSLMWIKNNRVLGPRPSIGRTPTFWYFLFQKYCGLYAGKYGNTLFKGCTLQIWEIFNPLPSHFLWVYLPPLVTKIWLSYEKVMQDVSVPFPWAIFWWKVGLTYHAKKMTNKKITDMKPRLSFTLSRFGKVAMKHFRGVFHKD